MMLVRVLEDRGLALAWDLNSCILGFVHVELIFAEDVTVVLDEVCNISDFYFKIKRLVQEILWIQGSAPASVSGHDIGAWTSN